MSIWEILRTLTVGPLELAFEFLFSIAYKLTHNLGLSIFVLSMVVNILVLPLYNRADELQEEEREKQKSMDKWMRHIKKTFTGDEKMMMLQTYYRQNDYNPIYVLKSSVSLLLQIPFFIAAYNFLSGLTLLRGASFGPIANLGAEDAMFMIGNFPINVLPILMTVINIVSGAIYTKGSPVKLKLQLYGVALVFLLLLYRSPSGLVFYWTLNNVFSLCKNIVTKLLAKKTQGLKGKLIKPGKDVPKATTWLFFATGVFLAVLVGGFIPMNVVVSSVAEFTDPYISKNPALYLLPSLLYGVGFFVLWFGVFYLIAGKKIRYYFVDAALIMSGAFLISSMLFNIKGVTLSSSLQYLSYTSMSVGMKLLNIAVIVALGVGIHFLYRKKEAVYKFLVPAGIIALLAIIVINVTKITKEFNSFYYMREDLNEEAEIHLSSKGKNVVVIMLDRAMGSYIPYIMENEPDLLSKLDGFTYYPNTVSYGAYTIHTTPSVFGGYEYTPERINATDETVREMNDEALKVMPVLFDENGYDVTVCDPPYAGFQWMSDLSIYDEYPDISRYNLQLRYNPDAKQNALFNDEVRKRNFFSYSIMTCMPALVRGIFYDQGLYNKEAAYYEEAALACMQIIENRSQAHGLRSEFMNWYYALEEMPFITTVDDSSNDTFLMLYNGLTHEPMLLQRPSYEPKAEVDNTAYDTDLDAGYTVNGVTMKMDTADQVQHYQTNVLTLQELSRWIELLKWEGIYDNTRIIIVADHGRNLDQFDNEIMDNGMDIGYFKPLLMVKDFNATEFTVSDEFMTNADVSSLATKDIIPDAKNPFTGNPLDGHEKNDGPVNVMFSTKYSTKDITGSSFFSADWYEVEKGEVNKDSFTYLGNY